MDKFSLFKHADQIEPQLAEIVLQIYKRISSLIVMELGFMPSPENNDNLSISNCIFLMGLGPFLEELKNSDTRAARVIPYAQEFIDVEEFCLSESAKQLYKIEALRHDKMKEFLDELNKGINLKIFGDQIKYDQISKEYFSDEKCSVKFLSEFDPKSIAKSIKYDVICKFTALPEIIKECDGRPLSLTDLKQISDEIFELVSADFVEEILVSVDGQLNEKIKNGGYFTELHHINNLGVRIPRDTIMYSEGSIFIKNLKLEEGNLVSSKKFEKFFKIEKAINLPPVTHTMTKNIVFNGVEFLAKFQSNFHQRRAIARI